MQRKSHHVGRRAVLGGGVSMLAMPALAQTPQTTLRLACLYRPEHSANRSCQWFADEVGKHTDGKLKITLYPNAVLGNEEEAVQGVRNGTIDICYGGVVVVGGVGGRLMACLQLRGDQGRRASRWSWVASGRYSGRVATACSSSTSAAEAPEESSKEPGTRSVNTRIPCTASTTSPASTTRAVSSSWE